jgi:hypothetical protein
MTKRKIENSETSKYENKQFLKFTRRNTHIPLSPLAKLHTICFLKTHKIHNRKPPPPPLHTKKKKREPPK